MALKVIFTKRRDTYQKISVSYNVQALNKFQFSILWRSALIIVEIQLY